MTLKADAHELVDIFSNARTKGEFTSMCTSCYNLECEDWGDYYDLIETAFESIAGVKKDIIKPITITKGPLSTNEKIFLNKINELISKVDNTILQKKEKIDADFNFTLVLENEINKILCEIGIVCSVAKVYKVARRLNDVLHSKGHKS